MRQNAERLTQSHEIEVCVRLNVEGIDDLVEHLAVHVGDASAAVEQYLRFKGQALPEFPGDFSLARLSEG